MIERKFESILNAINFAEFRIRFGVKPTDPSARNVVHNTLLFRSLNPQIQKDNMNVMLARRFGFVSPNDRPDIPKIYP